MPEPQPDPDVAAALELLQKRRLVLAIHDASFPSSHAGEDTGRGSPYADGGVAFLAFARTLGFDAVQLGPQGETTPGNASPYDATLLARSSLAIALRPLVDLGLVREATFASMCDEARAHGNPDRAIHARFFALQRRALREAFTALHRVDTEAPDVRALREELRSFAHANAAWLDGDVDPAAADLGAPHDPAFWRFVQGIAAQQHRALRARIGAWGLALFGDLQIGFSVTDAARFASLFVPGYRMGAPPSRTNPEGQPWGYPVLDPERRDEVLAFVRLRMDVLLDAYDGIRVDHPHGLVCPWVYSAHDLDPLRAVQHGARLRDAPDLRDHPALARYAIARPEQIERALPRHADGWVKELGDAQVDAYAWILDVVLERARAHGRDLHDVVCEVLSTQPYPLARVLERAGVGRFRVTQKAKVDDPHDVYRSDQARPEDWIMLGTHDTPPIAAVMRGWRSSALAPRARYLAERLCPDAAARTLFAEALEREPAHLYDALTADLFASEARQVMVFFSDLFGYEETYNVPGVVDPLNWTLRVRPDYAATYADRAARGEAMSLRRALGMALRARGFDRDQAALVARLRGRAAP